VFWYIANGVSKPFFEKLLATFAQEAGASRERIIILVLDNAGWHTRPGLRVPDGIRLVYLPPHSPELQPAECLWPVLDEPLANKHFAIVCVKFCKLMAVTGLAARIMRPHGAGASFAP
jgi:hypothetical protein